MVYAEVLNRFFFEMESRGIQYCVLHSYESLPEKITSDLDMFIEKSKLKYLEGIFITLETEIGWKVCQMLKHEYCCYYYVFFKEFEGVIYYVHLDFCTDYVRNGRICISGKLLQENRIRHKNFFILNPAYEFIYLLQKKLLKKEFKDAQKDILINLYRQNPKEIEQLLSQYFNPQDRDLILKGIRESDFCGIENSLAEIRKRLRRRLFNQNFWGTCKYAVLDQKRKLERFLKPSGFVISIQGPDGVGKTSVANQVIGNLKDNFRKTAYFHLKPSLKGKPESRIGSSAVLYQIDLKYKPNIKDKVLSPARMLYHFLFGYILSYFMRIYILKARSTFVVFDRYLIDYAIYPESKKYYWTKKLPLLLCKIAPKPDMTFYLDCPADLIAERKKELSIQEIELLQRRTEALAYAIKNYIKIDASRDIPEVGLEISREILKFMHKKYHSSR